MRKAIRLNWLWVPILLCVISAGDASAWWNEQWQYRQKISFDTTPAGADIKTSLVNVPMLIRLHSGNFNFANAAETGDDIRFVNDTDQNLLKHHVERFDIVDEVAYIWVKLPKLSGESNQNFIWMYYGNKAAVGGQDSTGTFDANFLAVFHLGEVEGMPLDASSYKHNASGFSGGQGLPSVIGSGLTLGGAGDSLTVTATPAFDFKDAFTFSAWVRIRQPQQAANLFNRQNENGSGILVQVDGNNACLQITSDDGRVFRSQSCAELSLDTWHFIAFTAQSNHRMAVYTDGQELSSTDLPAALPALKGDLHIGGSPDAVGSYIGDLDEVRVSNISRSADWIKAEFMSQGPESSLVQMGLQETGGGGGMPVFYLATVLKNITLDGWFIIGCLGVLAFFSWIVFLSKSIMVWLAEKENKAFKASYQEMPDPVDYEKNGGKFANSSLYRIFSAGSAAFNRCITKNNQQEIDRESSADNEKRGILDTRSINSIKAALEKGFMEESQRLNAWLVVLTMSITGGPFLGLLGTVWGVMNTFAAMAEAGEANIMAIAPGVASALSTTVVGLIVAIPALFAYNYLSGRIKNITADMMIAVDQFSVNVDEIYGVSK